MQLLLASVAVFTLLQDAASIYQTPVPPVAEGELRFPPLVNDECVRCMCQEMSECSLDRGCEADICGPLLLTRNYWVDAGRPTINGDTRDSPQAYENCANDYECATRAVEGYMKRYKKDCNHDGKIDCRDFASIHKYGPNGCEGNTEFGDQWCLPSYY